MRRYFLQKKDQKNIYFLASEDSFELIEEQ